MLYTNYKQVAEIILNSKDADVETLTGAVVYGVTLDLIQKYTFYVNLQNNMSPNVRLAVKSFSCYNNANNFSQTDPIGEIYIDNINNKNAFNSDSTLQNKLMLLNIPINKVSNITDYRNNDILGSSINIQNTLFKNNNIEVVVDVKADGKKGIQSTSNWTLVLVVYDTVMEENPKQEVMVKDYHLTGVNYAI